MFALTRYQYGGAEQLSFQNIPEPIPGKGDVLVRVIACGLNLSDWEGLTGRPLYARIGGLTKPRHHVLGSDVVGEVVGLGPGVVGWHIGQRVWADVVTHGMGGLAEKAVLPANRLAALPDDLDPLTAAALPQSGAIALAATRHLRRGQRILVNGAGGGSGTLIMQIAHNIGAHVTGVDEKDKAALMLQLGADQTIDFRNIDFTDTNERWDCIVDLVATRPAWRIRKVLSRSGRYVAFGGEVNSVFSALVTPQCTVGTAEGSPDVLNELSQLAMTNNIKPVIAKSIPLSEAIHGLEDVGAGKVNGKLVVDVSVA